MAKRAESVKDLRATYRAMSNKEVVLAYRDMFSEQYRKPHGARWKALGVCWQELYFRMTGEEYKWE